MLKDVVTPSLVQLEAPYVVKRPSIRFSLPTFVLAGGNALHTTSERNAVFLKICVNSV